MELVQRSVQGGILILAILVIRVLWLDRLPKRTFPILWSVALVRLLLPFSFSCGLSLYTLLQTTGQQTIAGQGTGAVQEGMTMIGMQPTWTVVQNLTSEQKLPVLAPERGMDVLRIIWWVGAIFMATFFVATYLWSRWNFRKAQSVENEQVQQWLDRCRHRRLASRIAIRQSDRILAPLTYGCLRPVILVPCRALQGNSQDLEFILQHEFMHIRHCDAVLKLVMTGVLCIHWFNPLVWVMCRLMNKDIELACDEDVLRCFGEGAKAKYAMALIGMEEKKRVLLPLYNGFSKNAIEERISLIMKYKKKKLVAIVASSALVVFVALVFATSAKTAEAAGEAWRSDGNAEMEAAEAGEDATTIEMPSNYPETDNSKADTEKGPASEEMLPEEMQGEAEYTLHYMQEGIPQEEPAYLYRGLDYCILIPKEGWKAYGPNGWMWESNDQVQFWVSDYRGNTGRQVESSLEAEGYFQTGEEAVLEKEEDGKIYYVQLKGTGTSVMGIHYAYPTNSEYQEGVGTILSAVAANFTVLTKEDQGLSEDGQQAEELVLAFWEAYLAGDTETIRQYLTEDYSTEIEKFPDGVDGHVAREAVVNAVKGLDIGSKTVGEHCEFWVEFWPAEEADSLEYLTISAVKEADGWKISWYGLER